MRQDDRFPLTWRQAAQRYDNGEAGEVRGIFGPVSWFSPGNVPGRAARAPAASALNYYLPLQVPQKVITVALDCH